MGLQCRSEYSQWGCSVVRMRSDVSDVFPETFTALLLGGVPTDVPKIREWAHRFMNCINLPHSPQVRHSTAQRSAAQPQLFDQQRTACGQCMHCCAVINGRLDSTSRFCCAGENAAGASAGGGDDELRARAFRQGAARARKRYSHFSVTTAHCAH